MTQPYSTRRSLGIVGKKMEKKSSSNIGSSKYYKDRKHARRKANLPPCLRNSNLTKPSIVALNTYAIHLIEAVCTLSCELRGPEVALCQYFVVPPTRRLL